MSQILEMLAGFIGNHAAFLEDFGNWILIPLVIIVMVLSLWVLKQHQWHKLIRRGVCVILFAVNLLAGSVLFMTNISLRPMVASMARVQRNVGGEMENFSFGLITDSAHHTLAEFKGHVVLLNFWATYCPGCIEEFPALKKLEREYRSGLSVIALSDEEPDRVTGAVGKWESPTLTGYYSSAEWMNLESFRPVTIIIDRGGAIQECFWGRRTYEEFEDLIKKYL